MELQALRYAAMISTLTFNKLVEIYSHYLIANKTDADAAENILEFLEWNEPDEENFAQEVKIVLASADFSKELTTSVMWLNDSGLDIRCIRMRPYTSSGETLLDIQTVIPIPEGADYQVKIQEKKQSQRAARNSSRDLTKHDLTVGTNNYPSQSKRWMMFFIVQGIIDIGGHPSQIRDAMPSRKDRVFREFEGKLDHHAVQEKNMKDDRGAKSPRTKRYFFNEGEIFYVGDKSYVLTNQWGKLRVLTPSDFVVV